MLVSVGHRLTDGGFISHEIHAAPRAKFHFDDANPGLTDTAVAIAPGLGGPRREQHLAEIRAINSEHDRRR